MRSPLPTRLLLRAIGGLALVLAAGCGAEPSPASPTVDPPLVGHVFVQDENAIWGLSIDAATGALRSMPGSPFARPLGSRGFLTADPGGRFLFHGTFQNVDRTYGYQIDLSSNSLKEVSGSPFALACTNLLRLRFFSAETGFAQCTLRSGPGQILRPFRLDSSTGTLTGYDVAITGPFNYPDFRIHPSGRFAFVAESSDIFVYTLANGGLEWSRSSRLSGDTFRDRIHSLEITPSGRFLYGAGLETAFVQAFVVDGQNGSLTRQPTPLIPETLTPEIAIDPNGHFVFATGVDPSGTGGWITTLRIDEASGALSIVGYVRSPGRAGHLAFSPRGNYLYHSHPAPAGLSGFRLDEATGVLTLIPGSPFPFYGRDIVTTP